LASSAFDTEERRLRCWLEHPPSVTRRVGHESLLIGRHRGRDIVVDEPIDFAHETISADLPERRFALLVTLLAPTDGAEPGTVIDDETICAKVWPRQPEKGRVDVDVLIQRARKDLIKAGLDGFRLIERTDGGTRFRSPLGVPVQLR
jgi:hypothetical protein